MPIIVPALAALPSTSVNTVRNEKPDLPVIEVLIQIISHDLDHLAVSCEAAHAAT